MSAEPEELYERLKAYEGRAAVSGGTGKDPVNAPMIGHWCEAMGDAHAAYRGPDAVAPPAMLQAWTLGGLSGHGSGGRSPAWEELLRLLEGEGYTSVVATDCEQEYLRPLRPGDRITFDTVIESISERKRTALGTGHFLTTRMDVRADGEPAGTHRFRILKYAPAPVVAAPAAAAAADADAAAAADAAASASASAVRRPRPVVNRDNAGFWAGVARRRLLIQRCTACGRLRFPWLPGCGECGSDGWDTVEAGGTGSVYSYVVMHHPPFPAFDPPYAVGLIELAEGVRIVAGVTGVPAGEVRIGMPVELEFPCFETDLVLPVFRVRPPGELAPLEIPVTRTLIVAGALASRDYQDVHHDAEAARGKGSPDVFMNILTTNGLVGRYVTDRLGERARLRKVAIRLGVPNYPGDTMVLRGTVVPVAAGADGPDAGEDLPDTGEEWRTVEVKIVGTNALGNHVTGTVTAVVPGTEAPEALQATEATEATGAAEVPKTPAAPVARS